MKNGSNVLVVLCFIYLSFLLVPVAYANPVTLQYFHQKGCHDCERSDPIVDQIEAQYKDNNVVIY